MGRQEIEPGKIYHSTRHICMNIEGCLRNFERKKITFFNNDDGSRASDKEARKYLAEC